MQNFRLKRILVSFNPLAGIRCFLTPIEVVDEISLKRWFQSPSGDSLFSDLQAKRLMNKKRNDVSIP